MKFPRLTNTRTVGSLLDSAMPAVRAVFGEKETSTSTPDSVMVSEPASRETALGLHEQEKKPEHGSSG